MKRRGASPVSVILAVSLGVILLLIILALIIPNQFKSVLGGGQANEETMVCSSLYIKITNITEVGEGKYNVTIERNAKEDFPIGVKLIFSNDQAVSKVLDFGTKLKPEQKITKTIYAGILKANNLRASPYYINPDGIRKICVNSYEIELKNHS